MREVIKKSVFLFIISAIYLIVSTKPALAASPQLDLRVTAVIDNINEYPGLENTTFYYDAKRIMKMSRTESYPALYPSEVSTKTFSWKHGGTAAVSWGSSNVSSNCNLLWLGASAVTDSHISLAYVEYSAADNLKPYVYDDGGRAEPIASFNWLEVINSSKRTAKVTLHFRYNPDIAEAAPDPDPDPDYSKTIDYLGDSIANPDTAACGINDYRIYLDVTTESYEAEKERDIIFVLDVSNSMETALGSTTRFEVLKSTVKNAINSLTQNPSNKISIVTFGTRAEIIAARQTDKSGLIGIINSLSLPGGMAGGTNYYESMLHAAQIVNDNIDGSQEKVIFFVSDGQPTASLPAANAGGYSVYSEVATGYAHYAAQQFRNVDKFYSVFIGSDSGNASTLQTITQMVNTSSEKYMVQALSTEQLTNAFERFLSKVGNSLYNVTIADELTPYVTYAGDMKVTRKTGNNETDTLTAGIDYSVAADRNKLSVSFLKSTISGSRYTLSFNIRANDEALEQYEQYGAYPHTGDPGTDYEGNSTSSGRTGFYSNSIAELRYSFGGSGSAVKQYAKPVVQAFKEDYVPGKIQFRKILTGSTLEEGMFSFQILQVIGDEEPVRVAEVKNDREGFITFNSINFDKPGQYLYEVKEIIPDVPRRGMTYDTKTLTAAVNVSEDGNDLNVSITYPEGTSFTNVYEPEPVSVNFEVRKELTGQKLTAGAFQFRLFNGSGDFIEAASNKGDGSVIFSPVEFTKPGTYEFSVRESVPMPADPNIVYDTKSVPITVNVADAGGYLTADVQYPADKVFRNQFVLSPVKSNIELKVVLSGMQLSSGMFKFEMTDGSGRTYSAINQADGKIRFTADFKNAGTYYFTVRQIIPSDPMRYMTYDKRNIPITVKVTVNSKGKLVTNVSSSSDMIFYNSYKIRGGIW